MSAAVQATPTETSGSGPVVGASDVVAQSAEHWNVSGTSVLVAWGLAVFGGVRPTGIYPRGDTDT